MKEEVEELERVDGKRFLSGFLTYCAGVPEPQPQNQMCHVSKSPSAVPPSPCL